MEKQNVKYALVTGATSGIGYHLAQLLAADGYSLVIVGRHKDTLEQVAGEFTASNSIDVVILEQDLFKENAADEIYEAVKEKNIEIEILINNAGQGAYGEFVNNELHRELDIIQLNIVSLVSLTKLFLQDMVSRGSGRIMNTSSIASKTPGPMQAVYHGTKAFVQSFTEAVRFEVKDTGVTLTALLPGATDTDFFHKAHMEEAKIVVEDKLDDAREVAEDGYKALMKGEDMVVSGLKNKAMVAMSAITPDSKLAANMYKQQKPVKEKQ